MDRLVYTALSGLRSQTSAQATIANNIANASTIGYRADRVSFDRMVLQGGGGSLNARQMSAEEVNDFDRTAGSIVQTARPLDVARSEERRVGKECSKQCRSRWSPYH